MVQLLHAFLEVARPVEPTLRPVALGRLVHDVLDLLEIEAALRRVQLTRRFESGPTLQLDQAQLRQVVRHLCLNAVHASPAGGRVEVTIGHEGPFVTLTVDDTGPGVALALRERIFEPFFTTDHTAFGAGLGLPIVRSIVTLHDGALIVTDAPIGGARFVVQLRG